MLNHGTLFYTGTNIEAKSLHLHLFQGKISQKRVTDINLEDFLQYGPQNEQGKVRRVAIVLMRLRITINRYHLMMLFSLLLNEGWEAPASQTEGW